MPTHAPNAYSPSWFALFLPPDAAPGCAEIAFLEHWLPRPRFTSMLDVCCGPGRHARVLARLGYEVIGIDRSRAVLDEARRRAGPREQYVECDMRRLDCVLDGAFDAVINLWQSFGGFTAEANAAVLGAMTAKLAPGGRLVLDLYNRDFFVSREGTRVRQHSGVTVTETKRIRDGRLTVHLEYGDGHSGDVFDWELYTVDSLTALGDRFGLLRLAACAQFDLSLVPNDDEPRMQLVFELLPRS